MSIKRLKFTGVVTSIAATAALVLAGCSGNTAGAEAGAEDGAGAGEQSDQDVKITLWTWGAGLEEQAALYMDQHPNVEVEFVNVGVGTAEYEKVRNALQAGTGAPDAFYVAAVSAPSFVATESILDLNELGAAELADQHIDWAWEAGEIDGGHYFYPVGWGPLMYFYRADLFEEYSIEVPKTWAEFADASAKLREQNPDMYLSNFPSLDVSFAGVLWQAGQQPFTTDGTDIEINWDGPETQKVAEYWQDLLDRDLVGRVPDFTPEWNQAIAQSTVASFIGGTWYTPMIEAAAPDQSGDWRVALLPQWADGENYSAEAGLAGFAITNQSKHPAETEEFLRWLTSSEESVTILTAQGNFPTFKPVLFSDEVQNSEAEFFGGQQLAPIFLESGEGIRQDYEFGPFMDVVATLGIDAVGQALQNETTLPAAMAKMQSDLVTYATDQGYTVN